MTFDGLIMKLEEALLFESADHLPYNFFEEEVGNSLVHRVSESELDVERESRAIWSGSRFECPIVDEVIKKVRIRNVRTNGTSRIERNNRSILLR